ncbi:LacI family DNA-binding transcriptional regulator [Atopobiaceae bacterium 24-176]
MDRKNVTISDIAVAAGVSKTTVSRYINGRFDLLSESTRLRVEKAIQLAHYTPSAVARSLKTQRSYLVGVIVANITTPFATSLLNGIGQGLREGDYIPIFADAGDSPDDERRLIDSLVSHQVDGLIVNTTTSKNPQLIDLANSGTPVVLCDRYIDDYNFDIAVCPYREPTLELMASMRERGFERAVFFTQDVANNSPRAERLEAFLEGDRDIFGASDADGDVYLCDPWDPGCMRAVAAAMLLESGERTVGAYATNTVTLLAVYNALVELGVTVGDTVGLCGPDDWGWAHRLGWNWVDTLGKGVTTFQTDPFAMGLEAARLMLERIADPTGKKQVRIVPALMS